MEIIVTGNRHSILDQYLAEIRDHRIQADPLRFRENLQRLGEIFAYEISKTLPYETREVITPWGGSGTATGGPTCAGHYSPGRASHAPGHAPHL